MYISRVVVRNFRNFSDLDIALNPGVTCIIGENNTGKSNLIYALRLVVDANLSYRYRHLIEHDIHSGVDMNSPLQVVVAVEFSDYTDQTNECGLVGCWEISEGLARLTYRFRPKRSVREALETGERRSDDLTLEDDYEWELTGGGPNDPATVDWNQDIGESVRFGDLQHFHVVFLPAVRDVRQDLGRSRTSPLKFLFDDSDIPRAEKESLVRIIKDANDEVARQPTISTTGHSIQEAFSETAGEAFPMDIRLGMSDPSFASIFRSLNVLMSNDAITDFEPTRNGLGLNNILYISMLLEYFKRRLEDPETAGQILLIEEPEAHLHPQLQRVLYTVLKDKPTQTILTTHSTHISSQAPLDSLVVLTNTGDPAIASTAPARSPEFNDPEIADLERYLDATRSTLLFARKVILVEGPAELFLIPVLVKCVIEIDLDRLGIAVVPIYGTHFDSYTKLFGRAAIPKKCAIIADGDLAPADLPHEVDEDELPVSPDVDSLANDFVGVFRCHTTFERATTLPGTLLLLAKAMEECGAPRSAVKLRRGHSALNMNNLDPDSARLLLDDLRTTVLSTAERFGKARFAQVASKYGELAKEIPNYIQSAIEWLVNDEVN